MRDILEVGKVDKDENWMGGLLGIVLNYLGSKSTDLVDFHNFICSEIITVLTFISVVFPCNTQRSRWEFPLYNGRSFMLCGNKYFSDFRSVNFILGRCLEYSNILTFQ